MKYNLPFFLTIKPTLSYLATLQILDLESR